MLIQDYLDNYPGRKIKELDPYYIEKQAEHDEMAPYLAAMFVIALGLCVIWAVVEMIKWIF